MTELFLVRHGQAGPTPESYDELSKLGQLQARKLGQWLLDHERGFSSLLVGQMRRQRETLEAIIDVYASAGRPLPSAEVLPGLDEYRFAEMVRAFAVQYPQHPELAAMRERPTDKRGWIALLRTTLAAWSRDELAQLPESYAHFQARTGAALALISERLRHGPVLAVSSGGVMSQIAQRVLGFSDATAIDVNLTLMNTCVCEYLLTRSGLKLTSLNTLPHLSQLADRAQQSLV